MAGADPWAAFPDAPQAQGAAPAAARAAPGNDPWAAFPDAQAAPAGGAGGAQPSTGGDIANATGSRLVAGALDIPGTLGDVGQLMDRGADWITNVAENGVRWALGQAPMTQAEIDARRAHREANEQSVPDLFPTSEGVKKAVGFSPYQAQTPIGQAYDKWVGPGVELAPSVLAGGGAKSIAEAAGAGIGAGAKEAGKVLVRQSIVPGAASEAAGEATKGTDLEPVARTVAAIAAGGKGGGGKGEMHAPDAEEMASAASDLKAAGSAKYEQLRQLGMSVKPTAYDAAIDGIVADANKAGIRSSSSPTQPIAPSMTPKGAQQMVDDLIASKGAPKTWDQLDELHSQAGALKANQDPALRRLGAIVGSRVDSLMDGLKPQDVFFRPQPGALNQLGGLPTPAQQFQTLIDARQNWRQMRNTERIAGVVAKAYDVAKKNYTTAGFQTALKQGFGGFKWQGKKLSADFQRLDPQSQAMVNGIIHGAPVENALRMVGKFNAHGVVGAGLSIGTGAMLGSLTHLPYAEEIGAVATPMIGEAARSASARRTYAKVNRLAQMTSGKVRGQGRQGRGAALPMSIFYSLAAQRAAQQAQQSGQ